MNLKILLLAVTLLIFCNCKSPFAPKDSNPKVRYASSDVNKIGLALNISTSISYTIQNRQKDYFEVGEGTYAIYFSGMNAYGMWSDWSYKASGTFDKNETYTITHTSPSGKISNAIITVTKD